MSTLSTNPECKSSDVNRDLLLGGQELDDLGSWAIAWTTGAMSYMLSCALRRRSADTAS